MPEGGDPFAKIIGREALEQSQGVTLVIVTPRVEKGLISRLIALTQKGRRVQLFYVHAEQSLSDEQKHVLQLLMANKVTCTSIHMENHEWKRIGGA